MKRMRRNSMELAVAENLKLKNIKLKQVFLAVAAFLFAALPVYAVTINEFTIPTASSLPVAITSGPDGNLWFTESSGNKIGKITTSGVITEYPVPTVSSGVRHITSGPDGNIWFTEPIVDKIGRITTAGAITEFEVSAGSNLRGITAGPDGNIWFTEGGGNKIGRITPAGVITEFTVPTPGGFPDGITSGPDGNIWFTEQTGNKVGKITAGGVITEFAVTASPWRIKPGSDGNLWFTEGSTNKIGRITTSGVITEYTISSGNRPQGITAGLDGNLWFNEGMANQIGRITTAGVITEFIVPTADSDPRNIAAGPDGNIWFVEYNANKIGQLILATVPPFDLSVSMTGTGKGRITVSPGFNCSDSCRQKFSEGETVTLTAENTPNATFNSWSGCDVASGTVCTMYMTGNRTISAGFSRISSATGTISGRVTDSSGVGVANVMVMSTSSPSSMSSTSARTDAAGYYSLTSLLPGTYIVQFMNEAVPRGTFGSIFTTNQYYNNKNSIGSADLVPFTPPMSLDLGTVVYPAFGQISGTVTDVGSMGIENVQVTVYDMEEQSRDSAYTDASGNYIVRHLPSGKYKIRFRGNISSGGPSPTPARNLVQQVEYVTVTAPETLTGINAILVPGQSISGRITNSQGLPVAGTAAIIDLNGNPPIASASTDATGAYTAVGIPPGSYKVKFAGNFFYTWIGPPPTQSILDVTRLYSRRYYGGSPEMDEAHLVTVASGLDATNINGVLDGTGPAINAPFIKDFGVKVVGESTIRTLPMVRNLGTADLAIGAISLVGEDFTILNDRCSGVTLPSNTRCTFQVSFAPTAEGDRSGTVTILSNDPDFPAFRIVLKGSGGAPTRPGDSGTTGVPSGDNVTVAPTPDVNLTFSSVSSEVEGEVTVTALTTFSSPAPSNFSLLDGTTYEITTTATFSGPVLVCIDYDPAVMANPSNEQNLKLFHYNGTSWEDITSPGYPDAANHTICGETTSFSEFAVFVPAGNLSPVVPPGAGTPQCGPAIGMVSPILGDTTTPFTLSDMSTILGGLAGTNTVHIDWGDGSPMDIIDAGATSGPHTYRNSGTYRIRKTVQDSLGFSCHTEAEVTISNLASGGFDSSAVTAHACVGGAALANVNVYMTSGHLQFHGYTDAAGALTLPVVANTMPAGTYTLSVLGPQGMTCYSNTACNTALPATADVPGTLAVYCQ